MNLKFIQMLGAAIFLFTGSLAHATITCTNLVSGGFSTSYAPTQTVSYITQGTISFRCTRSAAGDLTTVYVGTDVGANPSGNIARAKLGANFIQYDLYNDSGCSILLSSTSTSANIPVTLLANLFSQSFTVSFWGCITLAGQSVPSGTYVDTISYDIQNFAATVGYSAIATLPVSIVNPATCNITSVANVAFGTYIAFRATPLLSPAANVVMNCTTNLPYSLALDATSGLIAGVGLNYSLATSWISGSQLRGTGPGQTFTMTGTLPANQAGKCSAGSCSGSDTRTLTVTY